MSRINESVIKKTTFILGSLILSAFTVYKLANSTTKANAAAPCVVTIFGQQYDVSPLQTGHPGGNIFICGTDMTAIYQAQHGTDVSRVLPYLISTITPTATPTPTILPTSTPIPTITITPTATPSPIVTITPQPTTTLPPQEDEYEDEDMEEHDEHEENEENEQEHEENEQDNEDRESKNPEHESDQQRNHSDFDHEEED